MANRSITVTLRANVADFKAQFDAASRAAEETARKTEESTKRAETSMGRMVQSAANNERAWTTAGAALTGFGAVALGGLGLATKAALDWESAWAGVSKTVDGTGPQMAALEEGLRGLARELPASHQEIAAVAEAAGQLGVARGDIIEFTRTMINLGETTNLSADEAATAIAQFANVMGTSTDDVDRLGSALVALGNDGASTEADIMFMAQRLSGAGKLIGASEQDILGLSSALASVGISAEAGGGSLSRVLQKINTDVLAGGDDLRGWAEIAGLSADEFAAAWRESPVQALDLFLQGLNGVTASGGNAVGVLGDLGIKSTEETRALLSLAGASDLLVRSLDTANTAWDENTALVEEASKRYETSEARIQLAKNALVDAGISLGATILPAVADGADAIASLAQGFADLPGPVQGTIAAVGGIAGATTLAAGGFLLLVPRAIETYSAFKQLSEINAPLASGLGRVAGAATKAGLGLTALAAVPPILREITDAARGIDRAEFDLGMNELTADILEAQDSSSAFNSILGDLYDSGAINKQMFSDLGASVQQVANMDVMERFAAWANIDATGIGDVKDRFEQIGVALANLSQTDLPAAQSAFSGVWEAAQDGGATFDELLKVMPAYKDALIGLATDMGVATDNETLLKIATGELSPVVDEATGQISGFTEGMEESTEATVSATEALENHLSTLEEMANAFLGARGAARNYEQALEDANKVLEENNNAKHWEDGTEAAEEYAVAIDDVSDKAWANISAMQANGEMTSGAMQTARDDILATADAMGAMPEEAEAYVAALGLAPEDIETQIILETGQAIELINGVATAMLGVEGEHTATLTVEDATQVGISAADAALTAITALPHTATVDADTQPGVQQVYGFEEVIDGSGGVATVDADTTWGEAQLRDFQSAVNAAGGTVTINGNTMTGEEALSYLENKVNSGGGFVTIDGVTYPADTALVGLTGRINTSGGDVTVGANTNPARSAVDGVLAVANAALGIIDVDANTGGAESDINRTARDRDSDIHVDADASAAGAEIGRAARDRYATIYVRTVASVAAGAIRAGLGRASGGPIYGPGTGTSDSVPILASNGEHMLTAREVALAGGHGGVYRMRQAINSGRLRFAEGGGIENGQAVRFTPAPVPQYASAARSSTAPPVDYARLEASVTSAVRSGMESAEVIATVTDRVASSLTRRGERARGR